MTLHVLQHVPFEGPARIAGWARERGHALATTRLFAGEALPAVADVDRLVVMGGPMGVGDEAKHPWLADEKAFLREAIDAGRSVVGVCLGAQLVAEVLGARVYPNAEKEIGWFPVERTEAGRAHPLTAALPERLTAFHWHGDTFALPDGAVHLMRSAACAHQAFLYDGRVLGLQFHLEATPESVQALAEACADEAAAGGAYEQPAERLAAASAEDYRRCHETLWHLLDGLPV